MSSDLFVYGSMLNREVLNVVIGREVLDTQALAATLKDFVCREVSDETYPYLCESPGDRVTGLLVMGLSELELERVKWFESFEYVLVACQVQVGTQTRQAFVCKSNELKSSDQLWDYVRWERENMPEFLYRSRAFMDLYGKVSLEEAEAVWLN